MSYDVNLFVRIINFIVSYDDEPELYIELKNKITVDFTCYKDFIDAIVIVGDVSKFYYEKSNEEVINCTQCFNNIEDMLNNLIIDGKSLLDRWDEVLYIDDDNIIDYTKDPKEQFLVIDGRICYKPIR